MSYTEIFKFKPDGDAQLFSEVKNAWRGAWAIWNIMDERYLPEFIPEWAKATGIEEGKRYHRSSELYSDENALREVWDLVDDDRVSLTDKIVLASTFDWVIVKRQDIPELIKAFRNFQGETSLKEQADLIEKEFQNDDFIAIAWNQTSVNGDRWDNFGGRDENRDPIPYNIITMKDHFDLFSNLNSNGDE